MFSDVGAHIRGMAGDSFEGLLPPHYPTCLGCGPAAEQGFHLQVRREGDEVVAEHIFTTRHSGAPGIAHGGAVATVIDDVLGMLLYVVRIAGVTRHLEVDYLKPVVLEVAYTIRARVDSRDGRKLFVSCVCTDPSGVVAFTGKALFIEVSLAHFAAALTSGEGQSPVAP